jgi:hypothetical protein
MSLFRQKFIIIFFKFYQLETQNLNFNSYNFIKYFTHFYNIFLINFKIVKFLNLKFIQILNL